MTPEQISAITDPEQRAREAQGFVLRCEDALRAVRGMRDRTVAELREQGQTQRQIALLLGISPAMAAVIDRKQGIVSSRKATR